MAVTARATPGNDEAGEPATVARAPHLAWSGGEARLEEGDGGPLPAPRIDTFTATFVLDAGDDAAPATLPSADRRLLLAGPASDAPLPADIRATRRLRVDMDMAFMVEAAGAAWHPGLRFIQRASGGDDAAWLLALALVRLLRQGCAHEAAYVQHLGAALAVRLVRGYANLQALEPCRGGLAGVRLRACLDHIEANLHRDISVAELAGLSGISSDHLTRAFRRSLGSTPYTYFRRRRIERAKRLLRESRLSLARIAAECGYRSASSFCHAFRAETLSTPLAFRRMAGEVSSG